MARTFIRQDTQIWNSSSYDDSLLAGSSLETQTTLEGDLNALRSQVNKILKFDGSGNWYDAISGSRGISELETDLKDIEDKKVLFRTHVIPDISVPNGQNYVILSVSGNTAPSQVIAIATTQNGAVVAESGVAPVDGSEFAVHELVEIAGADSLSPKNLCVVRDVVTGEKLSSDERDIYALIQVEGNAADGDAFNDTSDGTGKRAKLSFVRQNAALNDLEAVPVADIEGKSVNYSYVRRLNLDAVPEEAFIGGAFVDNVGATDVTLERALANQVGPVTLSQNIEIQIADGNSFTFADNSGGDILVVENGNSPDQNNVIINAADLDVNTTNSVDFNNGIIVDSDGQDIQIGVTAGVIEGTTANDLTIKSGAELYLDDANQTGSTWAQTGGIKLSETTAEWDEFEVRFGEVSLLAAITAASVSAGRTKTSYVVPANVSANTDIATGADLSDVTNFVDQVDVYLNGVLMLNGADAAANNDVYPGTTASSGHIKFEFNVKLNDVITVVVNGV